MSPRVISLSVTLQCVFKAVIYVLLCYTLMKIHVPLSVSREDG